MVHELLAFIGLSAVVICTPGPDTALTIRNAIAGGRIGGLWTAAGVVTGQAIWTVAASVGVAGLLAASEPAFVALKVAGTAYLIVLGIQSLRSAWAARASEPPDAAPVTERSAGRSYRQGLLNDLGNPKMAAFFLSMLPQFVPAADGRTAAFATFLGLGLLFGALTFAWLAGYSVLVARTRRFLGRAKVRRVIDGVAGTVLIGFGVRLALARPTP
jgi:threonine/homoserine/homoserine lactone efflux protein